MVAQVACVFEVMCACCRSDLETHQPYASRSHEVDRLKYLFDNNLERELGEHVHSLGQVHTYTTLVY